MKYLKKFNNPAELDTFKKSADYVAPNVSYIVDFNRVDYNARDYEVPPFYAEAVDDSMIFTLRLSSSSKSFEYSLDCNTWTSVTSGTYTPAIKAGERVYFRASGLGVSPSEGIGKMFGSSGKRFKVGGNILSLIRGANLNDETITMKSYQFYNMFDSNTMLIDAGSLLLPDTTAEYCYGRMFYRCSSLISAPVLPAKDVKALAYSNMFNGCTSLVNVPDISATSIAHDGCEKMFYDCTSLVNAPVISATSTGEYSFRFMFENCTSLANAKINVETIGPNCCYLMFKGSSIVDINIKADTVAESGFGSALEDCRKLTNAKVNVANLGKSCFNAMFKNCTSLVNAPDLPATSLSHGCYNSMFYGCTSLVNAPALPATSLQESCYRDMFYGCTSLVNAPDLPAIYATKLRCYEGMFKGCTSLVNAPVISATNIGQNSCDSMFRGCTSLVNVPELSIKSVSVESCFAMFYGCTSLVNAPALPATSLSTKCYQVMFKGCSKLNYVKAMFTTAPSDSYTLGWLDGVSPTGTFVKNASATWNVTGVNGIPEGWTVETAEA